MLTNFQVAQDVTKLYHVDYYKSSTIDLDEWIIKIAILNMVTSETYVK